MAMEAHDIEALIRAAFPDAQIEITDLAGDGNHFAAEVIDEFLPRLEPRAAAARRLCGAEWQDGRPQRPVARACPDHQSTRLRNDR